MIGSLPDDYADPWPEKIEPWHPDYAKDMWLDRYALLTE